MKKITIAVLLLTCLIISSCSSSKVDDVAAFNFDNAWYWVVQFEDGATDQDIKDYVNRYANPNSTSYFFAFDKSVDLSEFATKAFNPSDFSKRIIELKPKYGFYKMMPADSTLHEDAVDLIKYNIR